MSCLSSSLGLGLGCYLYTNIQASCWVGQVSSKGDKPEKIRGREERRREGGRDTRGGEEDI